MLTTVRQIGNSRGVLIPAAFLASCQIEDKIDICLKDGSIVIKPIARVLRQGWFAKATKSPTKTKPPEDAAASDWDNTPIADDSEWQW